MWGIWLSLQNKAMTTRSTRIIRFFIELYSFHLLDCLGKLIGVTCRLCNDREDAAYMNIIQAASIIRLPNRLLLPCSQHSTEFYPLDFWLFAMCDGVSLDEMMILARTILRSNLQVPKFAWQSL
ncbi:uncharacterized protein LOC124193890 [Daphnia pulex]|uniref:uncharacterized protein LOC124193890 n=1 Tax=Daphnia pulex TaxID=6669 RepID=UPI001EDDFE24|nr:uncharacterized protein LOC124193890 [Daphnia pulex]XP_046443842.1 uncharacterized protein LOC124193890 [Daphnia pulex]